jgi:hypothetical protein
MEFENPKILKPIQVVKNVKSEKEEIESEEKIQTRTERFRRSRKGHPVKKKYEPEPSKSKQIYFS